MKGVSEFVLVLLILIIAIASILVVWLFYNSMFGSVTTAEDTSSLGEALSSCMKIDSARDNKIYLRNCGTGVVRNDSTSVYMDEAPIAFTMTPSSIGKGQVAEIGISNLWGMSLGNHKIRISNKAGEVERYVKAVLPDSCVLALEFDEGIGNVTYDSSPYHNDAKLYEGTVQSPPITCPISNPPNDCPQWTDGIFGKALKFKYPAVTGGQGYVKVPYSSSLNLTTNKVTVSAWIFNTSGTFVDKDGNNFRLTHFPADVQFNVINNTGSNFGVVANLFREEKWHNIVGVINQTHVKIYLDGLEQYSNPFFGIINNTVSTFDVLIGHYIFDNANFSGIVDSVRLFNASLNPNEIVTLSLGELE